MEIAGWLLATLADAPIEALVRRGLGRKRAVAIVWVVGAVPVLIDPGMGLMNFLRCVERIRPSVLRAKTIKLLFEGTL